MLYVIRYDEIGLKKGNRSFFEKKLKFAIKSALKSREYVPHITLKQGRLYLKIEKTKTESFYADEIHSCLKKIPGISSFSRVYQFTKKQDFFEDTLRTIENVLKKTQKDSKVISFKVEARRSDKSFPLNSYEICASYGEYILTHFNFTKVDLHNPDLVFNLEIRDQIYLTTERTRGPGGLPTGSTGKALVLLSGGIDSPVAALRLGLRGIEPTALHFHAYPYTGEEAKDKIKKLSLILKETFPFFKLYFLNFAETQKRILKHVNPAFFTTIMRRTMLRISENFALKLGIFTLATGESVGQVSSQTLESLYCTNSAVKMPVLKPLCCNNKSEIIKQAKLYGTYETSILPFEDCCTVFNPPHPATRPALKEIITEELKIPDFENMIDKQTEKIYDVPFNETM